MKENSLLKDFILMKLVGIYSHVIFMILRGRDYRCCLYPPIFFLFCFYGMSGYFKIDRTCTLNFIGLMIYKISL